MANITQGSADVMQTPCGTTGLAVCVGLACPMNQADQWLIAHIDCGVAVRQPSGTCFDAVAAETARQGRVILNNLGLGEGRPAYFVSSSPRDNSTRAMLQGLRAIFTEQGPVIESLGFVVAQGANAPVADPDGSPPEEAGPWGFSIPRGLSGC